MLRSLIFITSFVQLMTAFNLTIIHTNDVHARFEETSKYGGMCTDNTGEKCYGGVARRATMIKELRQSRPNSLLLDGGDQFQGTFWFTVYNGQATAFFNKKLGYDAMPLGNHEFDKGLTVLENYLANITTEVDFVSSNIQWNNEPGSTFVKPFVIKTINGRKVGIIGYTTPDTTELVMKGNLGILVFEEEVAALKKTVAAIKQADSQVNIIVAIGHSGYTVDQKIAKEVPDVDIVVGGHTNTFLYTGDAPSNESPEGLYPTVVNKDDGGVALCVQAFTAGKYVGVLDAVFDDNGDLTSWSGNPVLLNSSVTQDPEFAANVARLREEVSRVGARPLANSTVFLDGICRLNECNLGNMITDSFIYGGVMLRDDEHWSTASISLINGGSIRSSLDQGKISFANILEVSPFANKLVQATLKGSTIKKMFENSVSLYDPLVKAGRFLQISGAQVVYNIAEPVNSRVVSLKLRCRECAVPRLEDYKPDERYDVLLTDFMFTGGDGYSMIPAEFLASKDFEIIDADLVETYIKKLEIVYPYIEGRITVLNETRATTTANETQATTTANEARASANASSVFEDSMPGQASPKTQSNLILVFASLLMGIIWKDSF